MALIGYQRLHRARESSIPRMSSTSSYMHISHTHTHRALIIKVDLVTVDRSCVFKMEELDITYYAEFMSKIQSISLEIGVNHRYQPKELKFLNATTITLIYADLDNPSSKKCRNIILPEPVTSKLASGLHPILHPIVKPGNTAHFRLPSSADSKRDKSEDLPLPWTATDLRAEPGKFSLRCQCDSKIVNSPSIFEWKALPSENWAEMMDFWHCHKPDTGTDQYNKSYAASRFVPYKGCIFVGLTYFYIFPSDSQNIIIANDQIKCSHCSKILGIREDPHTLRIWKWNLQVTGAKNLYVHLLSPVQTGLSELLQVSTISTILLTRRPSYPQYIYASSTILQQIDSHASYTFIIKPDSGNRDRQILVSSSYL